MSLIHLLKIPRADSVDYLRVRALMNKFSVDSEESQVLYNEAASVLSDLEQAFYQLHQHPTLTCLPGIEGQAVNILPALAATIWRQQSQSNRFSESFVWSEPVFCDSLVAPGHCRGRIGI